jgi:hypothetical protein
LTNKPHGSSQKYVTKFHPVNVSAVIFKGNSNITLITMFAGELPKALMWRYDRKKMDHVEISQPAILSVYSSHFQVLTYSTDIQRDFSLR